MRSDPPRDGRHSPSFFVNQGTPEEPDWVPLDDVVPRDSQSVYRDPTDGSVEVTLQSNWADNLPITPASEDYRAFRDSQIRSWYSNYERRLPSTDRGTPTLAAAMAVMDRSRFYHQAAQQYNQVLNSFRQPPMQETPMPDRDPYLDPQPGDVFRYVYGDNPSLEATDYNEYRVTSRSGDTVHWECTIVNSNGSRSNTSQARWNVSAFSHYRPNLILVPPAISSQDSSMPSLTLDDLDQYGALPWDYLRGKYFRMADGRFMTFAQDMSLGIRSELEGRVVEWPSLATETRFCRDLNTLTGLAIKYRILCDIRITDMILRERMGSVPVIDVNPHQVERTHQWKLADGRYLTLDSGRGAAVRAEPGFGGDIIVFGGVIHTFKDFFTLIQQFPLADTQDVTQENGWWVDENDSFWLRDAAGRGLILPSLALSDPERNHLAHTACNALKLRHALEMIKDYVFIPAIDFERKFNVQGSDQAEDLVRRTVFDILEQTA